MNNKKDLLPMAMIAGAIGAVALIVGFVVGKKIKNMVAENEILYRERDLENGCDCSDCSCGDFEFDKPTENVADISDLREFGVVTD